MVEFLTTTAFVLSSIYGAPTDTTTTDLLLVPAESAPKIEDFALSEIPTREELELVAKTYFKDDPILIEIAKCESKFRHLDKDGNILRGQKNKGDLGLMQINEYYHADKAKEMGIDLKSLEGNIAYAQYLYDKQGTKPWFSSSKCWEKAIPETTGNLVAINK